MSHDKQTQQYADLVIEAEAAVKSVKDPDLKRVAFEKILGKLIERIEATQPSWSAEGRATTKKGHAAKGRKGEPRGRRGPKFYIHELIDEGFFGKQKTISEVRVELANRGHHIPLTSLSGPLQSLAKDKRLRRQKLTSGNGKTTYGYSNW